MTADLDTLKSLQSRIRAATGPDRELDCLIDAVLKDGCEVREVNGGLIAHTANGDEWWLGTIDPGKIQRNFTPTHHGSKCPLFTLYPEGLGACVALLNERFPECDWKRIEGGWFFVVEKDNGYHAKPLANDCLTFIDAIISAEISRLEALEKP